MALGLPVISVTFKGLAASMIERSQRGVVAVLLFDDTETGKAFNVYQSIVDIDFENWTEDNYKLLQMIFAGGTVKVIALRQTTEGKNVSEALKVFKELYWNYLCIPGIEEEDKVIVSSWIKEMREEEQKVFKAVLPNVEADHEGIINFTTDKIESTISGKVHSTAEYCARIAGVFAGMPLTQSGTYYVLSDIVSAETPEEPDEQIDKGELVIIYDDEQYKIGRAINSLVTFTKEKTEDFRFIKMMDAMDLYKQDIRSTFKNDYIGKYNNGYDDKQLFVAAVNAYNKSLEGEVLDSAYDNVTFIDPEAQKQYLDGKGTDTSEMSEVEILTANTGTYVFLRSDVKFLNAMEDLSMVVNM